MQGTRAVKVSKTWPEQLFLVTLFYTLVMTSHYIVPVLWAPHRHIICIYSVSI